MTSIDMWSALVGIVMPLLVSVVNQSHWPKGTGAVVAVCASAVAGGITCWLDGSLRLEDLTGSAGVILMAAVATYHLFWKPTGIAPAIESATSLTKPTPAA